MLWRASGCKEAAACQRMVGTPIQQCCLENPDSGLRGGSQGGSSQPGLHSKNQSQKIMFNIPSYSGGQGLLLKTELPIGTPVVVFPELLSPELQNQT